MQSCISIQVLYKNKNNNNKKKPPPTKSQLFLHSEGTSKVQ